MMKSQQNRGRGGKNSDFSGVLYTYISYNFFCQGIVDVPCDEPDFQEQEKKARQIPQMLSPSIVVSLQPLTPIDHRRERPAPVSRCCAGQAWDWANGKRPLGRVARYGGGLPGPKPGLNQCLRDWANACSWAEYLANDWLMTG